MARRIVITGASGNVGTALLRRLAECPGGYNVVGVARRRPPPVGVYREVTWHQIDVGNLGAEAALRNVFSGADCVVHTAWGFQPSRNTR